MPDAQAKAVEPRYINTNRELDDINDIAWFFDGREVEQGWIKREQSINTLRRLNAGNVATDFLDVFVALGLRSVLTVPTFESKV
ncbi:suppressor of tub2 mutation [Conoideocrella luteorostrata]|uniref:Suppressor of tub2 mutation n=1 Tax=Conoideocrella luteorostrata TaxID=1105319 RepID=A0AAJ0CMV2_9HYPO|nr:suppressor of tub2 mutation [Conoideocrella luteorostrata]